MKKKWHNNTNQIKSNKKDNNFKNTINFREIFLIEKEEIFNYHEIKLNKVYNKEKIIFLKAADIIIKYMVKVCSGIHALINRYNFKQPDHKNDESKKENKQILAILIIIIFDIK